MRRRMRYDDNESLAQAKSALAPFELCQVPVVAWETLREVRSTFQLDLDLCLDHVTPEMFQNLAHALKDMQRQCDACNDSLEAFWSWMALSPDETQMPTSQEGDFAGLSHAKALVAIIAHALGCSAANLVRLASAAGLVYLTLIEIEGAAQFWGTLFQPAMLHQLLRTFAVPLRAAAWRKRRIVGDKFALEDGEPRAENENLEAAEATNEALADLPLEDAWELLDAFVSFLRESKVQTLFQGTQDFVALMISQFSNLLSHPAEEKVACLAAAGLAALVTCDTAAEANKVRRTATAVIRAALPAVLMTQDVGAYGQTSPPSKLSQEVRLIALSLLCETVKAHPDLLVACPQTSMKEDNPPTKEEPADKGEDDPILSALQLMCVMGPDRAEYRAAAADSFVALLLAASSSKEIVNRAVTFLEHLLTSDRAGWRVAAAEAAITLLSRSHEFAGDSGAVRARFDIELLVPLIQRCRDVAPSVRAKAFGGVASAMSSLTRYPEGLELLRGAVIKGRSSPLIDLVELFRMSAMDEKALVRRAGLTFFDTSLQVLQSLQIDEETILQYIDVEILTRLAADESVIVRKAAITSMSSSLRECPVEGIFAMWVSNVLPLALDPEASVTDKAFADIDALLIAPICKYSDDGKSVAAVPPLLRAIDKDLEVMEYLKRVIRCLGRRAQATSPQLLGVSLLALARKTILTPVHEWPLVVWCMMQELAAIKVLPRACCDLVFEAWEKLERCTYGTAETTTSTSLRAQILGVFAKVANLLTVAKATALRENFRRKIEEFTFCAEEVQIALHVLEELEVAFSNLKGTSAKSWKSKFARTLDNWITSRANKITSEDAVDVCRRLLVLGELALMDEGIANVISGGAIASIQAVASNTIKSAEDSAGIDPTIRGHAFAALGKLCLRREDLAKKSVELFVLHLNARESFTVRNNVLIILRDLCERYTSLVDRFVACMTDLLRDANEILRKQSVMVLASLLSEDFIKFRGSIVHRFLYVLSDPSTSVRTFVECVFIRILHPRNPVYISRVFVDVVCGMNGWTGHPEFQSAAANRDFVLVKAPRRRAAIYRFMLSLLTNEQKFSVCSQMVTSFLTPFVEGEDRVDLPRTEGGPCGQALHDVLSLLVCKEMRICFSPKQACQEDDADLPSSTASQINAEAARTALAGMFKRVMCEHVVPVLVQLKNAMETQHSPFLGRLRRCLSEILRDFKEDLQEILPDDPQLAGELAFDFANSGNSAEASGLMSDVRWKPLKATEDARWKPLTQKRELCKTAINAAIRAAGKRRSLTTEMELNPNMHACEESHGSSGSTPALEKKSSACQLSDCVKDKPLTSNPGKAVKSKRGRVSASIGEPSEKRHCARKENHPSTPDPNQEMPRFSAQKVATPQSARAVGAGGGLIGRIMQLQATPRHTTPRNS